MYRKTILGSLSVGLVIGFVAGIVTNSSVPFQTFAENHEEKQKDPVVRELQNIEGAISDRHSPVVKELENISDELEEIAGMKREIEKIERHLDD